MTKYINDCGYVLSDTVYKDGNEYILLENTKVLTFKYSLTEVHK